MHTYMHTRKHNCTHVHANVQAHAPTHTHPYTLTHTRTYTHANTHIHLVHSHTAHCLKVGECACTLSRVYCFVCHTGVLTGSLLPARSSTCRLGDALLKPLLLVLSTGEMLATHITHKHTCTYTYSPTNKHTHT